MELLRGELHETEARLHAQLQETNADVQETEARLQGQIQETNAGSKVRSRPPEVRLRDEVRDVGASIRGMEESILARVTALVAPYRDLRGG